MTRLEVVPKCWSRYSSACDDSAAGSVFPPVPSLSDTEPPSTMLIPKNTRTAASTTLGRRTVYAANCFNTSVALSGVLAGRYPSGARSVLRLAGEPQPDQAAPVLHLGRVDEAAPVVQCHVVVGEEDVAGAKREFGRVGGVVEDAVEGVECLALARAQRPASQVVAQFDEQAVVADADAVSRFGEDRADRDRVLARCGLLRAVEAELTVEFVDQFGSPLQQRVVGVVTADDQGFAAGYRLAQAQ